MDEYPGQDGGLIQTQGLFDAGNFIRCQCSGLLFQQQRLPILPETDGGSDQCAKGLE
jgi:hypothetical protein